MSVHEFPIRFHISRVTFDIRFVISLRMISVHEKIRMIPVQKRKIQSDFQSLCPESIHIFFYKIPSKFCICDLIIRKLRIPECKSLVMLCCQNCVLKSRFLCFLCPFLCVKEIRVEIIKIFFVPFYSDLFQGHYPFMPCSCGKQTKVNEHPETVMDKPVRLSIIFRPFINILTFHPLYFLSNFFAMHSNCLHYNFFIFKS